MASSVAVSCDGGTPAYSSSPVSMSGECSGFPATGTNGASQISLQQSFSYNNGWYSLQGNVSSHNFEGAPDPATGVGVGSHAKGVIDFSQIVNSVGPARAGYLFIDANSQVDGHNENVPGFITQGLFVGFVNGTSPGNDTLFTCPGGTVDCNSSSQAYSSMLGPIPVTLGTDMTLVALDYINTWANSGDGSPFSTASFDYQFRFTELDGTSVLLSQTPEPGTMALLGLPLLGLAFLRKRATRTI